MHRDYGWRWCRRIVTELLRSIPYDRTKKTGFAAFTENHSSRENGPPNLNANSMLGHGDRPALSPDNGEWLSPFGKVCPPSFSPNIPNRP